jgi:hypothetical protein
MSKPDSPRTGEGPGRLWSAAVHRQYEGRYFLTSEKVKCNAHHLGSKKLFQKNNMTPRTVSLFLKRNTCVFTRSGGNGENTPEQFEAYAQKYFNIISFPWREEGYEPISLEKMETLQKESRFVHFDNLVQKAESRQHTLLECLGGDFKTKQAFVFIDVVSTGLLSIS